MANRIARGSWGIRRFAAPAFAAFMVLAAGPVTVPAQQLEGEPSGVTVVRDSGPHVQATSGAPTSEASTSDVIPEVSADPVRLPDAGASTVTPNAAAPDSASDPERGQPVETAAVPWEEPVADRVGRPQRRDFRHAETIVVGVLGDSLADGYWGGLYRELRRDERFEFLRLARNASGLARWDQYDWLPALEEILATQQMDIAVVSFGANDTQSVYRGDRRYFLFDSPAWHELYRQRVDRFLSLLREHDVEVFWIGMPKMRDEDYDANIDIINEIYASAAEAAGAVFLPLSERTVGEDGAYTTYLPDEEGRDRPMRATDGIHFTSRGYNLVAELLLEKMDEKVRLFADNH